MGVKTENKVTKGEQGSVNIIRLELKVSKAKNFFKNTKKSFKGSDEAEDFKKGSDQGDFKASIP